MDFFLLFVVLLAIGGIVYFIHIKFEELKKNSSEDQAQRMMLEVIQNLQKEVREGGDKNRIELQQRLDKTLEMLTNQLAHSQKSVDAKLSENTRLMGERLDSAAKVIGAVKGELGKMQEISGHITSLTDIFRNAKKRGGLGEEGLNEMLANALSTDQYSLQYRVGDNEIVDAVIKTKNGIIPIDSKFPMDNFRVILDAKTPEDEEAALRNFRKDVKKHIGDISRKYIRPEAGTVDFAIMYIPAESVHYEAAINDEELQEYARKNRVHMVSPNGLFYFLRIILIAFQSQKFEENAKKVLDLIAGVKQESVKFGENIQVLSKHVSNAKTKMDEVNVGYDRLASRIDRVTEVEGGLGDAGRVQKLEKEEKKEEKKILKEKDLEDEKLDIFNF